MTDMDIRPCLRTIYTASARAGRGLAEEAESVLAALHTRYRCSELLFCEIVDLWVRTGEEECKGDEYDKRDQQRYYRYDGSNGEDL